MNIVVIYAPTNVAEEQDMMETNSQVGGCNVGYEDVIGRFADGTMMNENGKCLQVWAFKG